VSEIHGEKANGLEIGRTSLHYGQRGSKIFVGSKALKTMACFGWIGMILELNLRIYTFAETTTPPKIGIQR
jgi:hypothetical protein